ncbi:ABC transporter ATP-binding protein/permease [Jiella sp. MQZ9-1]|uniref:ABC transporter ATP-binding protein n=1 Tax=Jiella flava TaxID=2816857 RepID=A0A939FVA6_9HYPH|nr:ABC transporter ATP-binding protein [Jiella flava]MBO0662157.1 ABC transporter ATP-binding protein [Jiella flava]MCD2471013.1 ABC transporter ATP-binding protein/permease [Jiella flava]
MSLWFSNFRQSAFAAVLVFTGRYWSRQPAKMIAISAIITLGTLADVLTPLFAGRLVDAVTGTVNAVGAFDAAIAALLSLAVLAVISVLARFISFSLIVDFTIVILREVMAEAFALVQRLSTDWHANSFAGSTVRKITRGMWALDLLNDTVLLSLLPSLVMLAGTTALLGWHWPVMGLVIGLGALVYLTITVAISLGFVAPAARLANGWDTKLGGALADAISCNAVVKGFGGELREEAILAQVAEKWQRRARRSWKRGVINSTVQNTMLFVLRVGVIGLAIWLWMHGNAGPGDLAYVLTAFFVLQGYLREVGMHIRNLQRSVNDMEELVTLSDIPLGVVDRPNAKAIAIQKGEIVFDRVSFHYGSHLTPLYQDLSLTIRAGERVGLVGHSGSGKSTLVKLIQRLYDVTDGAILIDGQDIAAVRQADLRAKIAIVQQEPILFHRSLAENVAYGRPGASMAAIVEAARLAGAAEFIARLPKGYQTLVGERGVKLSGGERQRVAIARAFLADAPILILDEATASLDSESEIVIQQAMERLMAGRTTLVVAHRLSTVKALDRLLVFDRGRIVEEGDHAALIARPNGIYRRLFERQALELVRGLPLESTALTFA